MVEVLHIEIDFGYYFSEEKCLAARSQRLCATVGTMLKVNSMDGKLFSETVLTAVQDQLIVNTKTMPSGTYIVTISDNKILYKQGKLEIIH